MKVEWLLALVPLAMLGLLGMAIAGSGPVQYVPLDEDEERAWLRTQGLTESDIDEIQRPLDIDPRCRCEPRRGYGTSCCPIHRSGE